MTAVLSSVISLNSTSIQWIRHYRLGTNICRVAGENNAEAAVRHMAVPCFGLPEKLACDRGADLTRGDLEQAAFQLGIELDFNPPRTPHFKGTVESFFDSLNDQLIASLPGRTFRSW